MVAEDGALTILYRMGVGNEMFPLLIFVGIGAMTDFGPLLENPRMMLLGAAGQFGIFGTLLLALALGFQLNEAASIGIIGAIDGPTSIYVSNLLAPHLLGPITVCAYSYMSLVPLIQPPIMRWLTTRQRAPDPHALHAADDLAADARPLPARGHPGGRRPRADGDPRSSGC